MGIIKEFKAFFLRHTQINTGITPDQEVGYPTQYSVNGKTFFNRFLDGDKPNSSVFAKLFESIPFKLESADTASLLIQGLAKKTIDTDAVNRNSGTNFTTFIEPHQLPEIILSLTGGIDTPAAAITVGGLTLTPVIRTIAGKSRLVYMLSGGGGSQNMLLNYATTTFLSTATTGVETNVKNVAYNAGDINIGDCIEITTIIVQGLSGQSGTAYVRIGGTNSDASGELIGSTLVDDSQPIIKTVYRISVISNTTYLLDYDVNYFGTIINIVLPISVSTIDFSLANNIKVTINNSQANAAQINNIRIVQNKLKQ